MASPIDSVLLIGFGGPTRPEEVMPFLRRVASGRGIPEERLAEVARHYDAVGGRSPYNELTSRLAAALAAWLEQAGTPHPVHVGMRNWDPMLADTIRSMRSGGLRHAAGIILAAHRSEASWGRYEKDVAGAVEATGGAGFQVTCVPPWFDDPAFLEACACRIEEAAGVSRRGGWPETLPVIFTAHSIPVAMAERSTYVADLTASCRGVADLLGLRDWGIAYQSRSGDGRTAWLGPDVAETLRARAGSGTREAIVAAIGFLSDHVEVLYDLDVEAAVMARSLGLTIRRAPCVNDHPAFVAGLGRAVSRLAGGISDPG